MNELTYFQVLELNNKKEGYISLGKLYEKNNTNYNRDNFSDYKINFIEFGKFCEYYNLDSNDFNSYDRYLECDMKDWNINNLKYESLEENQLYVFLNRLKTGEYKTIIVDEKTPLVLEDERYLEIWKDELYNFLIDSIIEVGYDTLKIINKYNNQTIFLEGLVKCSDYEIIVREYLDRCENTLIIKDNPEQIEFRTDNFHNIEDECYYDKCKNIIDINIFIGDESDPIWRMNWDAIWVYYANGEKQLWQRM